MPVSFKAAQDLTNLTPFVLLKKLLTHWFIFHSPRIILSLLLRAAVHFSM